MPNDSHPSGELGFLSSVLDLYWSLISFAKPDPDSGLEPGLGGQLLYAGRLDEESRALIVAANVAGAATLAATDDPAAQRQAIRDGIVDFAVTNLDEALRILKNEIRKLETVAVCVGAAPEALEAEMMERGVVPDLISGKSASRSVNCLAPGAMRVESIPAGDSQVLLTWSVASAPVQWLPKLDAIALDCLARDAWPERRWVRLAPRFLGRMARGVRALHCEPDAAKEIVARLEMADFRGEIGIPVEIRLTRRGVSEQHRFSPAGPPRRLR
jgi:hypothetical protein